MAIQLISTVLDCKNLNELVEFYTKLLDWKVVFSNEGFSLLNKGERGTPSIGIQLEEDYIEPVWPAEKGKQQMIAHLDFSVEKEELQKCVDKAVSLGAKVAETQYGGDMWTTMLDPAGHPFCFCVE